MSTTDSNDHCLLEYLHLLFLTSSMLIIMRRCEDLYPCSFILIGRFDCNTELRRGDQRPVRRPKKFSSEEHNIGFSFLQDGLSLCW